MHMAIVPAVFDASFMERLS